ncbi:hypothetical protein KGM_200649 [Danaus plexippus plexippus]|uniref:Uncharacterized protein n=1 Tax=Danaus plexippus plexippus TaxID=278856 RepID=A0A212FD45_DANPL|nr:hypothetical protein KGM_200649 [Danaus plexippus plexippus]
MLLQQVSSSPGPSGTASPKLPPSPRPNSSPNFGSRSPKLGTNSPRLGASPKYGSPRLGSDSPRYEGKGALEDEVALERLQTELKTGWTVHTGRDGRLYYCK